MALAGETGPGARQVARARYSPVLMLARRSSLVATLLIAVLAGWTVTVQQMRGMDAGPGTDLGAFGWFLGIWVTMSVAMMLPSAAPTVLLFSRLGPGRHAELFAAGYLLAWTAFGLVAYAVSRVARELAPSFVAWDERGPWVAGGALVVAGIYQVTPLKTACLRHCRSPLHFLLRRRPGLLGTVQAGFGHGGYCVGCCAGLMLALFAVGIMSLFWMALAALAILAEKVLPGGETVARALAVGLVALGIWIAAAPASVPGLHQPAPLRMEMSTEPAS